MSFEKAIVLAAACIAVAFFYWHQFASEEWPARRQWLIVSVCKGVAVPAVLWLALNLGLSPDNTPFMPQVAIAKARGGGWIAALLGVTGTGLAMAASYWAALTLAWLVADLRARVPPENRREFRTLCAFWSVVLFPIGGLVCLFSGLAGAGFVLTLWLGTVAHFTIPLTVVKKLPPMYARAIGKMKLGKYQEAEWEVIRELEKCADDFEGWLMLGELYAHHFQDLISADQTIRDLCSQPTTNGVQISLALNRLADWHLKLGQDPVAARCALEELCHRLPGTHFSRMAQQRIRQLPATTEELREQSKVRTIRLPALGETLDEQAAPTAPELSKKDAVSQANQCVEKLKQDPNNVPAREKLAIVFAEQLGKAEPAIEQLGLLLGMADQPVPKCAEWLGQMAAWHIKYRRDWDAARQALERLVRDYPQTPQALAARRRLNLMEMEAEMRKARAAAGASKG